MIRLKLGLEVNGDVGIVIRDQPAGPAIPDARDCVAARVGRVGPQVRLRQKLKATNRVQAMPLAFTERPASFVPDGIDDGHRNGWLQADQGRGGVGTLRPWASERDIQMIAARFSTETG